MSKDMYCNMYIHVYIYIDSLTIEDCECQIRVAFQVRIKPDSYKVRAQTTGGSNIDPKIPDTELEWFTKYRCVTVLVGLLVQIEGLSDSVSTY